MRKQTFQVCQAGGSIPSPLTLFTLILLWRTKMSVPETEGNNEDKFELMCDEAMVDLDFANMSQGEKEILATELAKLRWVEILRQK